MVELLVTILTFEKPVFFLRKKNPFCFVFPQTDLNPSQHISQYRPNHPASSPHTRYHNPTYYYDKCLLQICLFHFGTLFHLILISFTSSFSSQWIIKILHYCHPFNHALMASSWSPNMTKRCSTNSQQTAKHGSRPITTGVYTTHWTC